MKTVAYKGYHARIEFDGEDEIFVGHIDGIDDIVGFHADNVQDLIHRFHDAVDDYATTCEAASKAPETPSFGEVTLRVSPEVHAKAALAARLSGKSFDQWGEEVLDAAADRATA